MCMIIPEYPGHWQNYSRKVNTERNQSILGHYQQYSDVDCHTLCIILHSRLAWLGTQPWYCDTAENLLISYLLVKAAHESVPVSSISMSSQEPGARVFLNVHQKNLALVKIFQIHFHSYFHFSLFTLTSLSTVKPHII